MVSTAPRKAEKTADTEATVRLTVAQATIRFLANQFVERDGERTKFFAGCFGIFGHGNVAGLGQALLQDEVEAYEAGTEPMLKYVLGRNEQAMVHSAVAYARQKDRLQTWAVTASVGPGSTNMLTGAALATINRLPVLLLPADTFATRASAPVLQELELPVAATSPSTTPSSRCPGSSTGCGGPSSCRRRCSARCGCSPTRSRPARQPWRSRRTSRPRPSTSRNRCSPNGLGMWPGRCRSAR